MLTVDYGDRVEVTCRFDYSGPAGYFTFAQEIGTWVPTDPYGNGIFNTLDRWEERNISISPGTGQQHKMTFTIHEVNGLRPDVIYDMNWEIGRGSQADGSWELIKRKITDDIIKIAGAAGAEFANLSVSYKKL